MVDLHTHMLMIFNLKMCLPRRNSGKKLLTHTTKSTGGLQHGIKKSLKRLRLKNDWRFQVADTIRVRQSLLTTVLNGRSLRSRIIRLTKRSRLQEES